MAAVLIQSQLSMMIASISIGWFLLTVQKNAGSVLSHTPSHTPSHPFTDSRAGHASHRQLWRQAQIQLPPLLIFRIGANFISDLLLTFCS